MKDKRSIYRALTMITQFGLNMLVPIVMCTLLGVWLGEKFDAPFITVPLFLAGALAGFRSNFLMVKKMLQSSEKKK